MNNVVSIGICKGCLKRARLEDDGCKDCRALGPRWAMLCDKVRTDPNFALLIFQRFDQEIQREKFFEMFGSSVDHLRIRLVP